MNRLLTTRLSSLHFAATDWAAQNLIREGVTPSSVWITGNTGIDAVLHIKTALDSGKLPSREWPQLDPARKLILVTAHRRESFGEGFDRICVALRRLAERPDVQILYPVHRNPNVIDPVYRNLRDNPNIHLIEPLDYVSFVDIMRRAYFLITDSGGVQEEGPSLGKPILVLREKTERPEAVSAGTVRLTGTDENRIVKEATALLDDEEKYLAMARVHNPYGDGRASRRIADAICSFFEGKSDV
jgi:UDP-N-acetylglucosamine 2-epimerase